MSIVVSDTSPIRALAHLNLLGLLKDLFGQIIVPPAVDSELRNPAIGISASLRAQILESAGEP